MKKALLTLLIFLFLFTCACPVLASAEILSPYERAKTFVAMHPRRDIPSGGEAAAADTIAAWLASYGYDVSRPSLRYVSEDAATSKKTVYEYGNVIGRKNYGKGKTILIGGYFGGFEPTDSYGTGEGATNALTVGALLYVAEALAARSCDYDLAIAFWGGVEIAGDFAVSKCGVERDEIALYINFDCIAAGAYDYLYADDLPRAHEKYFREIAEDQGADILPAPTFKKPISLSYGEEIYSYSHLGLLGVNRFFMEAGVPCVNFVGGAWDYDCGLYRYRSNQIIEGSSLDTLDEINERNGGKEATEFRLLAAANVVIKGVTGYIAPVLDEAAKETSGADLDSVLAMRLVTFIGIPLLILFFLFPIFRKGKSERGEREEIPSRERSGDDPYEELRSSDSSSEGDPPSDGEEDDGEGDVFRF